MGCTSNTSDVVDRFLDALDHPRKAEVMEVRRIVLGVNDRLTEHVKWNAPSFCHRGEDRVTFRLNPPERLQLIFHGGARAKDSTGFAFEDTTGLLQWAAPDRAVLAPADMQMVEDNRTALETLVRAWTAATDPEQR